MASRAEVDQQNATQAAVADAAWTQFQTGWVGLSLTTAALASASAVAEVQELLAGLVSAWGEVSSTLAADFYDNLRDQAGIEGSYTAPVLDPLNVAQVERLTENTMRTAADRDNTPDAALPAFAGHVQRLVRQAQRDTILSAAGGDTARVRIARIPTGSETCAFCLVLASRGYVYRSLQSAGQGRRYHDHCDCALDVSFDPVPVPPDGYDPGELYGKYDAARAAAGTGELRKVLAQMRLLEGIR